MANTNWTELAVFGGAPAFPAPLHVGRPALGNRRAFFARVESAFDRARLTNDGPLVREFEDRIAARLGVRHCVAVCNGTVGLEIAARALDLRGNVIVPSFTFAATAHALAWLGITPIFCDVDPATHNLDPDRVEACITPETTAILGVHLWGQPCFPDRLASIADRHGLQLLFDAAHAFGSMIEKQAVGSLGRAEVFSFHATKFFHSLEGGAVTTDDDGLAERLRLMRNFGFAGLDNVVSLGTNGKLNEISAAMGLTQLEELDERLDANRTTYLAYRGRLAGISGLRLLPLDVESNNCQYVVVEIEPHRFGLTRDQVVEILRAENVLARRYFFPGIHRMAPYRDRQHAALPVTEALAATVMVLPGGALQEDETAGICALLERIAAHSEAIAARLETRPV